jgi:hypothetical protein
LAPEITLDREVLAGWRLFDIHRHESNRALSVELEREGARLRIEVSPEAPIHVVKAGGLGFAWQEPGPAEHGIPLARRLASVVARSLGGETRDWRVPPASQALVAPEIAAEIRFETASLADDPDRELLLRDMEHYLRLHHVRPEVVRVVVAGTPVPGVSIRFPATRVRVPSVEIYPLSPRLAGRRVFRRCFAELGCTFEDGLPICVPTPDTWRHALERVRGNPAPFVLAMQAGGIGSIRADRWVKSLVLARLLPIRVAPRWMVELHRALSRAHASRLLSSIPADVATLRHDVPLHALGWHAISDSTWTVLLADAQLHLGHFRELAEFFETTLTRTAWRVWEQIDDPSGFAAAFDQHLPELRRTLERIPS